MSKTREEKVARKQEKALRRGGFSDNDITAIRRRQSDQIRQQTQDARYSELLAKPNLTDAEFEEFRVLVVGRHGAELGMK
jgi:hypothetical protein